MNSEQFDAMTIRKTQSMLTTHWPRAQTLLAEHPPRKVVEIMQEEGYWGRTSNRISLNDLQWLQNAAAGNRDDEVARVFPLEAHDDDWIIEHAEELKSELLERAKAGDPQPAPGTVLGRALEMFTRIKEE